MGVLREARAGAAVEADDVVPFDSYVRARSSGLLRLAWLITRDWEDARDSVQDAFVSVYPRWSRLPPGSGLDAYVSRCVVNACLAVMRGRRTLPVADVSTLDEVPVNPDPAIGVVQTRQLLRWCGELPPVQRAALVMRFYRDLSFADIAEVLGCREATARSHVHRAITALRTRWEGDR
jgi:RNA polymerase sigma factor (sigma-70 family)